MEGETWRESRTSRGVSNGLGANKMPSEELVASIKFFLGLSLFHVSENPISVSSEIDCWGRPELQIVVCIFLMSKLW